MYLQITQNEAKGCVGITVGFDVLIIICSHIICFYWSFNDISPNKNIKKVNGTSFLCIVLLMSDVPVSTGHCLVVQHLTNIHLLHLNHEHFCYIVLLLARHVIKSDVDWLEFFKH